MLGSEWWEEGEGGGKGGMEGMWADWLLDCRLKLKRPQTAKKFRAELDQLYAEALAEEELGQGKPKARL